MGALQGGLQPNNRAHGQFIEGMETYGNFFYIVGRILPYARNMPCTQPRMFT